MNLSKADQAILNVQAKDLFRLNDYYARGHVSSDECVTWVGAIRNDGYGQISISGRPVRVHRLVLFLNTGTIGEHVLHSCDNPVCINPQHMSWGSDSDNARDKVNRGRHHNQKKTHCPQGHEYTDDNLAKHALKTNRRQCLTCLRTAVRESQQRLRDRRKKEKNNG